MDKQKGPITRRDFMQTTGAGVLAAGLGGSLAFPERTAMQSDKKAVTSWKKPIQA